MEELELIFPLHLIKYLTGSEAEELMGNISVERKDELQALVRERHLDRMIELYTEMELGK